MKLIKWTSGALPGRIFRTQPHGRGALPRRNPAEPSANTVQSLGGCSLYGKAMKLALEPQVCRVVVAYDPNG